MLQVRTLTVRRGTVPTDTAPQLTQLHRHSRGTARWSPGKPGNPLRQPRGWPPTGTCWPTSMIHCSSSGARGQSGPNPVVLILPGGFPAGTCHTPPRCRRRGWCRPFPGDVPGLNHNDQVTRRSREKPERPRIMGEAEGPEWHGSTATPRERRWNLEVSRWTGQRRPEVMGRHDDRPSRAIRPARRLVGMGDRSNGTGSGRTDVRTSNLRTIDRILYRFPDGEADGSGTVLEDG